MAILDQMHYRHSPLMMAVSFSELLGNPWSITGSCQFSHLSPSRPGACLRMGVRAGNYSDDLLIDRYVRSKSNNGTEWREKFIFLISLLIVEVFIAISVINFHTERTMYNR